MVSRKRRNEEKNAVSDRMSEKKWKQKQKEQKQKEHGKWILFRVWWRIPKICHENEGTMMSDQNKKKTLPNKKRRGVMFTGASSCTWKYPYTKITSCSTLPFSAFTCVFTGGKMKGELSIVPTTSSREKCSQNHYLLSTKHGFCLDQLFVGFKGEYKRRGM